MANINFMARPRVLWCMIQGEKKPRVVAGAGFWCLFASLSI